MSCAGISFCSFSLLVWSWQKKCLTNILYMSSQGNSCDFFFFSSAPYAFLLLHTGSSSSPCFDTQAPGCCVLSKTRRTTRETAGIPIWSRSDSCSACAASAQRCPSTHTAFINSLKEHYTKNCLKKTLNIWHGAVKKKRLVNCCISSLCVCLSQTGHVKCTTIKCPALPCDNPVAEPQQCCPRCTGTMSGISSSKHLVSQSMFSLWFSVLCGPPQMSPGSPQGWGLQWNPAGIMELSISRGRPSTSTTSSPPSKATSV